MKSLKSLYKAYAVATLITLSAMPANSAIIEMALVLDGSGSMGSEGFTSQTQAYQNIFSSETFYDDFLISGDQLYVSSWQFSTNIQLEQDWFLIEDNATASVFGASFAEIEWMGGWTNTALTINTVSNDIIDNNINGDKQVINISTDGLPCLPDSLGGCPQDFQISITEAVTAANNGIVLNAIGIGDGVDSNYLEVITNPSNGFFELADDISVFQSALERSLSRDINNSPTPVSEPGSLALFGLFIVGIAAKRRRKA
jgi:hypothetical protein